MFFYASKVIFFFLQPSNLGFLLVAIGWLWARFHPERGGSRFAPMLALGYIALVGFLPIGNFLLLPLENRFGDHLPAPPAGDVAGIIILGGFEDGWVSAGRGGLAVNEAAERLTEAVRLARALPEAKVVFTGGIGGLVWGEDVGEPVHRYLRDVGIDEQRIVIEHLSRTTYENAIFTRDILQPRPGTRWLLVTSAFHMPRSVGTFRAAGFDVVPYPVDFRMRGPGDLWRPFGAIGGGLERIDLAAKEWIGLVAYRLSGRSNALFPGP